MPKTIWVSAFENWAWLQGKAWNWEKVKQTAKQDPRLAWTWVGHSKRPAHQKYEGSREKGKDTEFTGLVGNSKKKK